ncbi:MAG: IgGFc-binding protein [Myxococcota bacterium]|nr:IgGFc-binding protein [Myxococcota bacterium]
MVRIIIAVVSLITLGCAGSNELGRRDTSGGSSGNSGFVIDNDGGSTGVEGADGADGNEGTTGTSGETAGTADGSTSPDLAECNSDTDCPTDTPTCAPQGVCIFCYPGTYVCDGDVSLFCSQYGESYEVNEDCAATGGTCNSLGGKCESACGGGGSLTKTNAGCDFVAVDLENAFVTDPQILDAQNAQFAVIASNTSKDGAANVTVTMPDGQTMTKAVAPQSLEKFELPPTWSLSGTNITNSAFRVTSDRPITLYQFNPLSNEGVFSNDASVLLPTSSNGNEYYVVTKPSSDLFGGYFTIVATSEGETDVTITPKGSTAAGGGVPSIFPNTSHLVTLGKGQVLNVVTQGAGQDLTGSRITSSKPIAVMSGHTAINTDTKCCADHLEQQMPSVNTWGVEYVVGRSQPRGTESDYVRVVASEDGTTVTLTPAVATPSTKTLNAGDYWEFKTNTDVKVAGDKPIMVAQMLASSNEVSKIGEPCTTASECGVLYTCDFETPLSFEQVCLPPTCSTDLNCPGGHVCIETDPFGFTPNVCYPIGDPALILAVPIAQWQNEYVFLTPDSYAKDYITIVTQADIDVTLDGVTLPSSSFSTVSGTSYAAYRQLVNDGVHRISANGPVSITVYGYDQDVSYGYPGGLGLSSLD